jgi:uncharacterized protein YprB with RNaseH-like and TPR domain
MADLDPVAFDIETSGVDADDHITVAGFAHELGEHIICNHAGHHPPDHDALQAVLSTHSTGTVELTLVPSEAALLDAMTQFISDRLDDDRHYLTAYNGETWNGGFDLPFCRTAFIRHDMDWPLNNIAYADVFEMVDHFATADQSDLVGVYDHLVGDDTPDPFDDSTKAVHAYDEANWQSLLLHNLADIQRTRELALLAEQFVPKSDFPMKNLATHA